MNYAFIEKDSYDNTKFVARDCFTNLVLETIPQPFSRTKVIKCGQNVRNIIPHIFGLMGSHNKNAYTLIHIYAFSKQGTTVEITFNKLCQPLNDIITFVSIMLNHFEEHDKYSVDFNFTRPDYDNTEFTLHQSG